MKLPRIMIAAPKSGSGKTIITCGLLESLKRSGAKVRSYKCGPDYIDPMFHRRVIGVPGGNLDMFFSSADEINASLCAGGGDAAVIEGVMGIYDGIAGTSGRGSCYDIASATDTPVLLVMDVKGMGQTMLSLIKGMLLDDRNGMIRAIVLNRVSGRYYESISPAVKEMLADVSTGRQHDVKLIGGIPDTDGIHLESRHLGLKLPHEAEDLKEQVGHAADLIESHIDMDALRSLMERAPDLPDSIREETETSDGPKLTLAVARDEAFCFYYEENLRALAGSGIAIKEFSPLHDAAIPEDADGLLFGGGYPELYAAELASNKNMLDSVSSAIKGGMPSIAECGGFMYLMDSIKDKEGKEHAAAGVISGETFCTGRLSRFGYIELTGTKEGTLLSGLSAKGHEFHYFDSSSNGSDAVAVKPGSGRSWECMHAGADHIWGYPHLWYLSCPELVRRFKVAMESYRKKDHE